MPIRLIVSSAAIASRPWPLTRRQTSMTATRGLVGGADHREDLAGLAPDEGVGVGQVVSRRPPARRAPSPSAHRRPDLGCRLSGSLAATASAAAGSCKNLNTSRTLWTTYIRRVVQRLDQGRGGLRPGPDLEGLGGLGASEAIGVFEQRLDGPGDFLARVWSGGAPFNRRRASARRFFDGDLRSNNICPAKSLSGDLRSPAGIGSIMTSIVRPLTHVTLANVIPPANP